MFWHSAVLFQTVVSGVHALQPGACYYISCVYEVPVGEGRRRHVENEGARQVYPRGRGQRMRSRRHRRHAEGQTVPYDVWRGGKDKVFTM